MKNEITLPAFSRRSFMRTTALAGGGLLIGVNFLNSCKPEAKMPEDISQLNFNDFNAYIKIADNGKVTIFSPNPEIGQGVKTSMPMIVAEELDVAWKDVYVEQAPLDTKNFTRQVAGGSQSIRHGWDILRQTGANARQMLIHAAAKQWEISPADCKVLEGVISDSKGNQLGYGDVVKAAAALDIQDNAPLKDPSQYKIIGRDALNVDIDKIISGKPLFGLDYSKPGMHYACVLRPPAFGRKLVSFDDSETKKVTGVTDVFRFEDKIAVVATNTWAAKKGKEKLQARWDDEKLESTEDHDRILLGLLDGKDFETLRADGDVKKAFAEADRVIERTYESPFLPHSCMEPMNFFADVTDEEVELTGPIQTPEGSQKAVAEALGVDIAKVRVNMTRMGGGFGRRLIGDFVLEAAKISDVVRKPIKLFYTREDDMTCGQYRPAIKYRIAASLKDGKITGYHLKEAAVNSNMYGLIPNFFPAGAIENYQVDVANYKSHITTAPWRAPYTNFLAFAEQSFLDELFEIMETDPIQARLDLLDNVKGTTDERIQYSPERMQEVIRTAVTKSGWNVPASPGVFRGFSAYYCHNSHVAEVVDVTMNGNGMPSVKKVTCVVDCGIVVNPTGARNQVEGGVIDGIGHAMYGDLSFENGTPGVKNFGAYRLIRMEEAPEVDVHFIQNGLSPTGLGEPALPPAGAALANAIKKATGKRILAQPFTKYLGTEEKVIG
ncbi:xanthine dehydrogenase family protein molybdopterin-binding subunit [Sinomicrobium oceani]|uniref:xanthine dehydrogenase family protein molybdopterin-binding subunit n=1 Tax=Sinomicrobium oceani TaxID=1150368 RepID=UPI00227B6B8D|nr:molybdopterin cofactor-binding domain-containing protein [Sinomicrobium oceani]